MSERELIFELLFRAMLEIRVDALENKSAKAFKLADLFHNLPKQLFLEIDEQEILLRLRELARIKGVESWLDHATNEIEKSTVLKTS